MKGKNSTAEKKIGKEAVKAGGKVAKSIISAVDVLGLIRDVTKSYTDLATTREVQKTERERIDANREITLKNIDAKKAIIMDFMQRSFAERADNFQKLFAMADDAIGKEDNERLSFALSSITEIAKSSPFKDLMRIEDTQRALLDPKKEWKV